MPFALISFLEHCFWSKHPSEQVNLWLPRVKRLCRSFSQFLAWLTITILAQSFFLLNVSGKSYFVKRSHTCVLLWTQLIKSRKGHLLKQLIIAKRSQVLLSLICTNIFGGQSLTSHQIHSNSICILKSKGYWSFKKDFFEHLSIYLLREDQS